MTVETEAQWKEFYRAAGIAALLIVLVGLVDTVSSMLAGEARENSVVSVAEWFAMFQSNRFAALSSLGIFNILTLCLGIPLYLALYQVHRRTDSALAALAALLFFIGVAIYVSSNTVFSMQALSGQYAAALEAQKPALEAAGKSVLAVGADLTPGTFMGFLFTQLAGLLMSWVVLRGGRFGRWTAWLGLAGFGLMLVFFSLAAFVPAAFSAAMLLAMPAGLLLIAYQILLARRFFQMAGKGIPSNSPG